jgi:hypothetical protein
MNHEGKVRDMERAAVERWFARSPLGTMFVADARRMLPMPADAIQPWREQAYARIDQYITDSRPPPQGAMVGVILAFTCLLLWLQPILGLNGGQIGGIVMGGLLLWHGHDVWLLWRFRQDQKALRARIAASLALRTPVPAELGDRFRRGNPWRIVLHVWIYGLVAMLLLSMHFMPVDSVSPIFVLGTIGAVGVAWVFYFLARRIDLAQASEATLASRPAPPISRP